MLFPLKMKIKSSSHWNNLTVQYPKLSDTHWVCIRLESNLNVLYFLFSQWTWLCNLICHLSSCIFKLRNNLQHNLDVYMCFSKLFLIKICFARILARVSIFPASIEIRGSNGLWKHSFEFIFWRKKELKRSAKPHLKLSLRCYSPEARILQDSW